jgi:pimeloyl-ACP methyl ester carboxylesterase
MFVSIITKKANIMFKSLKAKSRRFWLTFVAVFIGTVLFQMAASGVLFAAENMTSNKQFVTEVSGSGKPVILIPGLMSDSRVWDELVASLSSNYQVHKINIAGFADTAAITHPSMVDVKAQLLAYIQQQKLQKPAVIGHSLGGFMSFWLASSAPKEIGPIVSVDGLPFIGPIFTRSNDTTVDSLAGQAKQIRGMYAAMSQQQLSTQSRYGLSIQATSDESKARVMQMIDTSDPKTVAQAMYELMSVDLRQDIANITSPVLLLGASGGFSNDEQKAQVQRLYAEQLTALPSAQLLMNTTSRHFIMFDDPKWLEQQIVTFLGANL